MDTDDLTRPLEAVMRDERRRRPVPLRARDRAELFEEWARLNPDAMREMELTALAIDARGIRVSAKYLVEKQRYEGSVKLVGVPFTDCQGVEHLYGINNSDTALIARWLLGRHPDMDIEIRKSIFDKREEDDEGKEGNRSDR